MVVYLIIETNKTKTGVVKMFFRRKKKEISQDLENLENFIISIKRDNHLLAFSKLDYEVSIAGVTLNIEKEYIMSYAGEKYNTNTVLDSVLTKLKEVENKKITYISFLNDMLANNQDNFSFSSLKMMKNDKNFIDYKLKSINHNLTLK